LDPGRRFKSSTTKRATFIHGIPKGKISHHGKINVPGNRSPALTWAKRISPYRWVMSSSNKFPASYWGSGIFVPGYGIKTLHGWRGLARSTLKTRRLCGGGISGIRYQGPEIVRFHHGTGGKEAGRRLKPSDRILKLQALGRKPNCSTPNYRLRRGPNVQHRGRKAWCANLGCFIRYVQQGITSTERATRRKMQGGRCGRFMASG